ncbi:hypothetical protein BH24ACT26_BH24ACT26_02600 [soil metagenome]
MVDTGDPIAALQQRLIAYPTDRYPIQHATSQFHLGVLLTNAQRFEEATSALRSALEIFDPQRLPVEHAKALIALGASLRGAGRADEASLSFRRAAGLFRAEGLVLEEGAAWFNLGLVHADSGERERAVEHFSRARELLDESRVPAQAAAAARELGATLVAIARPLEAQPVLAEAVALAERVGDLGGLGAAANALGLARLAAGDARAAIEAFETATAANPRRVRPEGFAIARCNLALAYRRQEQAARARLAARQALAVPGAPAAVVRQASSILADLGGRGGDLIEVLDDEPVERWLRIVGQELVRWTDIDASERRAEASSWIDGQLARPPAAAELSEALLGALLELPPDDMSAVIRGVLEALADKPRSARERFVSITSGTMARFPIPQWTRLRESFAHLSAQLGRGDPWG